MATTTARKALREAVANSLGLLIDTTITAKIDDDTYTIDELVDYAHDPEMVRDAWLYNATDSETRCIATFDYPTDNEVHLARETTLLAATDPVQIYFMLPPKDFDSAINDVLQVFKYEAVDDVTLVASQREYTLSSWIEVRGQVIAVRYYHAVNEQEEEVGSYTLKEEDNAVVLQLHNDPWDPTNWAIEVRAQKRYAALASDAATTTAPYPLIFHGARVAVLQKIFHKYGTQIKRLFGPESMIAEREFTKAKTEYLPPFVARELHQDEAWLGPDLPSEIQYPSW